jgi:hypothetical protein
MLQKDPQLRISAVEALNHRWFHVNEGSPHTLQAQMDKKILLRIKEFRAP